MQKTILITGATDGIGLETAKALAGDGHQVLVHGRNPAKLAEVQDALGGTVETYQADFTRLHDVTALADAVSAQHARLDVLINNAGILKTDQPITPDGQDARFVVNTLAPCLLTRRLLPLLGSEGRVVNLSSAAQAPVDPTALAGERRLDDMEAYAQSKLALTILTREIARELGPDGPMIVAVNPGSLLASKMVKEGFGVAGHDLSIGVDILVRAALSKEFADASGRYFDNDADRFADPHRAALDTARSAEVMRAIDAALAPYASNCRSTP